MVYFKNIVLLVVSLYLYFVSSYGVDMIHIYFALAIFLIGSYDIVRPEIMKKNYLTFNLIFLFSFFCVTYLFPIAIMDTDLDIRLYQARFVDFNYITQAVCLSTVAICCYFIAYKYSKRKPWTGKNEYTFITGRYCRVACLFNLFLAIAVILNAVFYIISNKNSINITESPFLNQIYEVSFVIALIGSRPQYGKLGFVDFYTRNKIILAAAGVVILVFLYVGDRGLPVQLVLCLLATYSFYYSKLRLSSLLLLGFAGALVLFALRVTRNTTDAVSRSGISAAANATQESLTGSSSLVIMADLYGASQELCLGYEYTTKEGLTDPAQILTLPFNPIPKLPTVLNQLFFNKTPFEMSSGYILNQYMSKYSDSSFGSHCVIDIYMKWGFVGVIFFFSLFGYVIALVEKGREKTMFSTVMVVVITGLALYIPRDSIIDIIRPMFYTVVLIWLYESLAHQRRIYKLV